MDIWEQFKGWYLTTVLFLMLAAFGGLIGSVLRAIDTNERVNWFVVIVETMASAFSGMLVILLCQALGMSLQWTGLVVGVCGWVGGRTTMLWLENRVRKIVQGDGEGE